jgi:hypothetical protein
MDWITFPTQLNHGPTEYLDYALWIRNNEYSELFTEQ